jgi:2-dehydropantoate 2-reductase
MRFEVIGSGAMGLLFATRLSSAGYNVHLWTSSTEKTELLRQQGVTAYRTTGEAETVLNITSSEMLTDWNSSEANHYKKEKMPCYVVLAVKQAHISDELLTKLTQRLTEDRYDALIALQNGYGHIEKLSQHIRIPLITAVTSEASKTVDRRSIVHTGRGETWIGDELGRDNGCLHQKNIEKSLQKAGFTVFMSKNIKEQVYRKLISNAVINPLTALFNVANGELPQSKQRRKLMEAVFLESKHILMVEEPELANCNFDDIVQLCIATATNTSSMRADLLRGAETEVAYINGAISAIAARHQLPASLNESIVHMIEALHPDH